MDNLAENNKFIELFEKLYDVLYMYNFNHPEKKEEPVVIEKSSFFDKFKNKAKDIITEEIHTQRIDFIDVYTEVKNYLDNILSNQAQGFWTLWSLCQFLRWAEKVFLYDNDPEKGLFIDSGINEDERCIFFKHEKSTFMIKLELLRKPEVKLTESAYNEVITILIDRDYGKQIKNKYISVDQYVELLDDSDTYTLNQVNRFLNLKIKESFNVIITKMLDISKIGRVKDIIDYSVQDVVDALF